MTVPMVGSSGVTLIELLVVITVVGILAGAASIAVRIPGAPLGRPAVVDRCRRTAVDRGTAATVQVDSVELLCLPDGQVVGAGAGQFVGRVP